MVSLEEREILEEIGLSGSLIPEKMGYFGAQSVLSPVHAVVGLLAHLGPGNISSNLLEILSKGIS